jgi:peptidoglycan/xylan/chitin deacetylase (PgdA/CDA1 family)
VADARARARLPVLTYHSIDETGSPVSVAAAEFLRQMQALASAGWRTLSLDDFLRGRREGGWPARTFLLTFDDGYVNLLHAAVPIAARFAFTGIVFVASGRVGGVMSGPDEPRWTPPYRVLDWDGLRAVAAAGWTIGSHAHSHRRLPSLAEDDAVRELETSKAAIEDAIGARVAALAYPYGAVSASIERLAAARYEVAFGTTLACATPSSPRGNIERIDAYYLRRWPIGQLDGGAARLYLAFRRVGRAVRGHSL